MPINQSAIKQIAEDILRAVEAKISANNRTYMNTLKNYKVDGDHIVRETLTNIHIKDATINKAKIRDFVAEVATIAVAEIASAEIDTAQIRDLSAYVANITMATIENAEIDWAEIGTLTATIAAISLANIESARINFAQIDGLTAGVALIQEAVGGKVQIADLSVGDANIVGLNANKINVGTLSVERLVIVGSEESIVYAINESNGTTQLSQTTIDGGSITQKTITADQIVAGGITAECLNVAEIFANEALIGVITSANINTGELFANEGVINQLESWIITTDTITSINERLLLKADKSVTDGLTTRIETAELKITPAAIVNTVRSSTEYADDLGDKTDTETTDALDNRVATVEQTADKISWVVSGGTSSSNMQLTDRTFDLVAENINLGGRVTFNGLDPSAQERVEDGETAKDQVDDWKAPGKTTIDGGKIEADTVKTNSLDVQEIFSSSDVLPIIAENIDLTGRVTFNSLDNNTQTKVTKGEDAGTQVENWKYSGKTTIDGGKVEANTINATQINVSDLMAQTAVIETIRSNSIPRVAVLPENPVAGQTLVYTGGSSDEALQWTGSGINPDQRTYSRWRDGASVAIPDISETRELESLYMYAVASQSGSGDVSPNNVRAIHGISEAHIITNRRNVLRNSNWTNNVDYWNLGSSVTRDPNKLRGNNVSIKINRTGLTEDGYNGVSNASGSMISAAAGETWTASVFVWVDDHTTFDYPLTISVRGRDANGVQTEIIAQANFMATAADVGAWKRITATGTFASEQTRLGSVSILMRRNGICWINSPQLEVGTVGTNATSYDGGAQWAVTTIPLPRTMYGLPDAQDELMLQEGGVQYRTDMFTCRESSGFAHIPALQLTNTAVFQCALPVPGTAGAYMQSISSHFPRNTGGAGADVECHYVFTTLRIRVAKSRLSGWSDSLTDAQKVALFNAWLAAQNTAGQPVQILYARAENGWLEIPETHIYARDDYTTISSNALRLGIRYTGSGWKRLANDIIGTNVTITDDKLRVATQEVEIAILGADGEEAITKIDEGGAYFPAAYAPNIAPRWTGPYTLTVNPAAAPDEDAGVYNSLQTVADALAGVTLDQMLTIIITSGATLYNNIDFRNITGAHVRIQTSGAEKPTVIGYIYLTDCPCGVRIGNTQILTQRTNVSSVGTNRNCLLILENCIINRGAYTGNCVHVDFGASAYLSGCEFYGGRGVYAAPTSKVTMVNCKGGDFTNGAVLSTGATVLCGGTIPAGTYSRGNNGILDTTGCTQDSGASSTPPAVETVATYAATASGYYRNAWQSGSQMRQGYTGYELTGWFRFNNDVLRPALSGKTIKDAKLRLRRISGLGVSTAIKVRLYGTTKASKSGGQPDRPILYGEIGAIGNGKTATFTIPNAAITDLASGTINAFVLYARDGSTLSGKSYSANYGGFYGVGDDGPQLTVTY